MVIRHFDGFKHKRQISLAITIEDSPDEIAWCFACNTCLIVAVYCTPGVYGAIVCDCVTVIWYL